MHISANGFMNHTLTMQMSGVIAAGTPVKLSDNYTVSAASAGDSFCGILLSGSENVGAVQMKGTVTLPYSGTAPTVGHKTIVADGNGGIQSAETGTAVLILAVDSIAKTITCIL